MIPYENRDHCLYVHINKINGKAYFGITRERPQDRWGKGSGYKEGTRIKNAIRKYGWDGFDHIVLFKELTNKEALDLEKYLIKTFKTQDKEIGYNVDSGGKEGYLTAEARRKSKEAGCTRDVICLENSKVYNTATEAAEDLGLVPSSVMKACNSKRYVLFNYHFMHYHEFLSSSEKRIQEIKDMKPKCFYNDQRKVVALETREVFENAKKAQEVYNNTTVSCILCCCKKGDINRIKAGGVHWVFLEEYEKMSDEDIKNELGKRSGLKACKPVINLSTMKKYISIEEASHDTGISSKTIRHSCKGTRKTRNSSGKWMFLENYEKRKI